MVCVALPDVHCWRVQSQSTLISTYVKGLKKQPKPMVPHASLELVW